MAFNIDDPLGSLGLGLGDLQSGAFDVLTYVFYGIIICGIIIYAYLKYQDKKVYIYPVRIYRQRHNGMVKEFNTFGGYIKKGLITQFNIKMSRFKKKPADKLPLSEFMDEDNRVYYWQVSPESSLIQVKRDFILEKVFIANENFKAPNEQEIKLSIDKLFQELKKREENKNLKKEEIFELASLMVNEQIELQKSIPIDITTPTYSPIPTDLKQQAISDINQYKNALGADKNKQFAYWVAGVISLAIVAVVLFYIAINKGDIPIITKLFTPLI